MSSSLYGQGLLTYLRPKLELKKHDGSATYFSYDAWNPPGSGPRLIRCIPKASMLETGEIEIVIEDSGKALNAGVMNGNKFVCSISADGLSYTNFLAGYIRRHGVRRLGKNVREIHLYGYGNLVRTNERLTNLLRMANRQGDNESPDLTDTSMKCSEIAKDLFEDVDHLPIGGPLEPFSTAGVEEVSETLASIRLQYVEWSAVLNRLRETSGAIFNINASDQVIFRYPTFKDSGITIKSIADFNVDLQDKVGYFVGEWNYEDSIEKSNGFANRLYGLGGTDFHLDLDKFTDAGQEEFYTKDIAMQFVPNAPRLAALSLKLSRMGTLAEDITGAIHLNKESTNEPGEIVGSFTIFKNLVGTSATTINRVNVSMFDRRLQVDKKYWIVLHKRGDANNHTRWHHDNGTAGVNATRAAGVWTTNTSSRTYTYRLYSSVRVLAEASDPNSINRFGLVEARIDAPWVLEGQAMDKLLTGLLQDTARQHRVFTPKRILSPKAILEPGTLIRLVDANEGLDMQAEIQWAQYSFTEENALGTRYVTVQPIGFVP